MTPVDDVIVSSIFFLISYIINSAQKVQRTISVQIKNFRLAVILIISINFKNFDNENSY